MRAPWGHEWLEPTTRGSPPVMTRSGFRVLLGGKAGISWQALGPPFPYFPRGPIPGPVHRWLTACLFFLKKEGEIYFLAKSTDLGREKKGRHGDASFGVLPVLSSSPLATTLPPSVTTGVPEMVPSWVALLPLYRGETLGPALVCHLPLTAGMTWAQRG